MENSQEVKLRAANALQNMFRSVRAVALGQRVDTLTSPLGQTLRPGQHGRKRCKEVVKRQRNQRRVVRDDRNRRDRLAHADSAEARIHFPHLHRALAGELAQKHLQIVQRLPDEEQHDHIRNDERATTIFKGSEREAPNIPQANGCLNARHQKMGLV